MRPLAAWALAGGAAAALAGPLAAQQPDAQMPGTPVGTPLVQPVGAKLPQAVSPVGTGPGGVPSPLDPRAPAPPGQVIDLKNVVAPYPGMPKPPPSIWEQLEQRWFALFQSDQPAQKPTTWTPGIGRRNRERDKARQQQEWWRRG